MSTQAPKPSPLAAADALTPALAAKLVLTALLWGGTFVSGKVVANHLPPMVAAFGRYVVAAVLLLWVVKAVEGRLPRINRQQGFITLGLGLTGIFLYNVFFFAALAHIPAGRTALLVALNPIITAMLASVVYRERLGPVRWLGIAIALVGASIVITRGDLHAAMLDLRQSFGLGETMMLAAVVSWAVYTLISRKAMQSLSPLAATTYASWWGLLMLSLSSASELGGVAWAAVPWQVWLALLYLGAFGTVVAFVWYYEGVRAVGPSRTAVFTNLVPVFGVVLAAVVLGENILVSMVVGGAVTVVGVMLTSRNVNVVVPPPNVDSKETQHARLRS
ncbi:DMT family transporter [Limnobacter sp.]|uniref:DMT family transporter n=1 Tax=Limnobacter sp. TaxID=2003368 RepID=UPI0035129165